MENSETHLPSSNHATEAKDEETEHDTKFQASLIHHQGVTNEMTFVGQLVYEINGNWIPEELIPAIVKFRANFKPRDSDIILASLPKSGTTWLKALTFAIVNRNQHLTTAQSPLLSSNPHALVPFFEFDIYSDLSSYSTNIEEIPSPRIFSTHMHFDILPNSILDLKCPIIYICRNPMDQFVSYCLFILKNWLTEPLNFLEELEKFREGINYFGPFWKHVLGYWEASLQKDLHNVLFLKYEDLKADPIFQVKKIAEFLNLPFSAEEEKNGVVEQIVKLCSFENIKNLEVNKSGIGGHAVKHSSFFRKGENGDWVNYVPALMGETVKNEIEEKLKGSGLSFEPPQQM